MVLVGGDSWSRCVWNWPGLISGFLLQTREYEAALRRPPLPGALVLACVLLGMCSVFVVSSIFAATRMALVRTAPGIHLIALGIMTMLWYPP